MLRLVRVLDIMGIVFEKFPITPSLIRSGFLEIIPNVVKFPCKIRKLAISECVVSRIFLTTLCGLPNLEVLKIEYCVFETYEVGESEEEEWEITEGDEFRSLQFLSLRCYQLEEVPCDIGDIPTLQEIFVRECGASVVASALNIQKVQKEEYDNNDLKVLIQD
ncbi:hypothetical protein SASPL_154270 [Salvia splendens]|uniref:Disease resistance protein RPS2 n=1 Tax=Salvia splendens TaxID=180675 RepID=A0A8X8VZU5_SALSN|nr:hypothetical protein SASPL_154267 [Salvia splendens]KAG6385435.1 hypothetical protein SASPL_154270 [Salvia splendens]